MKNLSKFLVFTLIICSVNTVMAQTSLKDDEADKAAEVKTLVTSGRYTFEASKEVARKGDNRSVRPGDDLDISKDTLIAYLPSVGKKPMTPVMARAAGITCTHFSYNMTPETNGSYNVSIRPEEKYAKEIRDIKKINMHISKEGYATVTVDRTNHSPMVYYGYIKEHGAAFPSANRVAMR
jgi:hypothetical protein